MELLNKTYTIDITREEADFLAEALELARAVAQAEAEEEKEPPAKYKKTQRYQRIREMKHYFGGLNGTMYYRD